MNIRDLITFYRARLDAEEANLRDFILSLEPNVGTLDLEELAARRTVLDAYEQAERYDTERAVGLRYAVQCLAVYHHRHPDYREEYRPGQ
ncbi:DUF6221 family protein [Streptomyces sp. NPDC096095]|uniref:DUF6221 family protein n=1 Tax=Streptomyces sp. NPDC096095 TaxID=3155545 RepID=UPI00332EDF6D